MASFLTEVRFSLTFYIKSLAQYYKGFPGGSDSKESTCNAGDLSSILGQEDPLEKGKATQSSILVWAVPWTEEPGLD